MVWWRKTSPLLERSAPAKTSRYVCFCVDRSFARQVLLATCLAVLFVCVQFWFLRPLYRRGVEISERPGNVGVVDSFDPNRDAMPHSQQSHPASNYKAAVDTHDTKDALSQAEVEEDSAGDSYSSSDESKAEDFGAESDDPKVGTDSDDSGGPSEDDEVGDEGDAASHALTGDLESDYAESEASSQGLGETYLDKSQGGQAVAADAADDGLVQPLENAQGAARSGSGLHTDYDASDQEGMQAESDQEGAIPEDSQEGSLSEGDSAEEGSLQAGASSVSRYHPAHVSDFSSSADVFPAVSGCAGQEHHHVCEFDGRLRSVGRSGGAPFVAMMKQLRPTDSHASNLLMLPTGDLLCAWFNGVEGGDEVDIVVSQLQHGSSEWGLPVVASRIKGRSQQNPVMWHDPETNTIHLLHTSQAAHLGQGTSDVRHVTSSDEGLTWTPPVVLFAEPGVFTRNQLLRSSSGSLLLPMYYTPEGYNAYSSHYCVFKESVTADFSTWEEYIMTRPGDMLAQPTVVQARNGDFKDLVAFFRSRLGDYIYSSRSDDEGKTWSRPARTVLPNNNSGIQAALLSSGTIAIVFNNRGGGARYPLSIALSEDGGNTWPFVRDIETGTSGNVFAAGGEYSYPSILQDPHGMIHVTYTFKRETIKYVSVSEAWVRQGGTIGMHKGVMHSQQTTRVTQLTRGYAVTGSRPGI
eukprot:jgi/Mesvir1/24246/Mv10950-RA.1